MVKKPNTVVKSILGKDFFEALKKSDIIKLNNKTTTSIDEIKIGLQIVPRTIMSFLISSLSNLEINDNKEFDLPFASDCYIQLNKKDHDSFTGFIYSRTKNKKLSEFNNRSIPGVGLVLMSTFELYDMDDIKNINTQESQFFHVDKLQNIIDERLRLHFLISKIVDEKIAQKDAIEILIKEKLAQVLKENKNIPQESSSDKLKNFLKNSKREFHIIKTEHIGCSDCGFNLYDGGKFLTLCICYGEDWNKNIKIKKSQNSIKMQFPKHIDPENIEMLLNTLKNINKE